MTCQSNFKLTQPSLSLCDRLKQRYESDRKDWQTLFRGQNHEKNSRDIEFIRYIVNFIIEQAKYNIVISELPDVIRTLHTQAEKTIRKNRMITLEEAITQVQLVGAVKYPYLKRVKPMSIEDFAKEVMQEVFDRLGTIITLDRIENISQFTNCSAKQLLQTMPTIDVNEAATLIIEDILRNQHKSDKNSKITDKTMIFSPSSMKLMNKQIDKKLAGTPLSERVMQNANQSYSDIRSSDSPKTKKKKSRVPEIPFTSHQTINVSNSELLELKELNSHFAHISNEARQYKSIKESEIQQKEVSIPVMQSSLPQQVIANNNFNAHETYSIQSKEDRSIETTRSSEKLLSESTIKPLLPITSRANHIYHSKDRPSTTELVQNSYLKEIVSNLKIHPSIHCYQHSEIQAVEMDADFCPLEATIHHRFLQQI